MSNSQEHRKKTEDALKKVVHSWVTSPHHVQAMAGHVIEPMLAALHSISAELATLKEAQK